MSKPERDLVSSSAGLAAAITAESGGDLGEGLEPVRARSYWEQVWIRFRRDEFLRLLYGARVSLEVAVISTFMVMTIGTLLGTIAGYFRGWIDTIISRIIEVTMAFPALLFIIALAATVGQRLNDITFGVFGKGVVTLVLVFSIFGWFYPARIVRSQVLSLREKEFVEAARMVGAND